MSFPLAKFGSDHVPIHIDINLIYLDLNLFDMILRDSMRRFQHYGTHTKVTALMLNGRFKTFRNGLKEWSKNFLLNINIEKCSYILALMDGLEDQRPLSLAEKNFSNILINHTRKLMVAR
jgi:hypothetical protein